MEDRRTLVYPPRMELRTDPEYSERLASFFTSLGQRAVVAEPGRVDVALPEGEPIAERELAIYLRVWAVMHPDAVVTVGPPPAA